MPNPFPREIEVDGKARSYNNARAERKEATREDENAAAFRESEKRLAALVTMIGDEARAYKKGSARLSIFRAR